jgi:hypothetical protein
MFDGAIEQCCSIIHQGPRGSQHLASPKQTFRNVRYSVAIRC